MNKYQLPISDVIIGERVRKDMGDVQGLADSMKRHGLLHPIVVKNDKTLVAGHRRIEAARILGWQEIPVTIIDVADLLSAERDENAERKDFTPSEAVAIGRLVEEREKPKAAQRKHDGKARGLAKQHGQSVVDVESPATTGEVAEIAAKAVGMGRQKYKQAQAVVAAAESDPEKFGDLQTKMDENGNVYGAHREMERRKAGDFNGENKRRGFRKDKTAPFDPTTKRHREAAEGQKRRMVSSISIVTGHCRGLEELDAPMAMSVCTIDEIKTWEKKSKDISRAFRTLALKLQKGFNHGR